MKNYYEDANPEIVEQLQSFRQSHPMKHLIVNGEIWDYYDSGAGAETILLLVGGLRVADAAFRSIPMLESHFRVITPTYPALHTMEDISDGLVAILEAEKIETVHILAGSFGGMVAQAFLRHHPELVGKVILSTTSAPDPEAAMRYQQELDMVSGLPEQIIMEGAKQRFYDLMAPPPDEEPFWRAYLDELYSERLDKEALLSTYHALIVYMTKYKFSPDDFGAEQEILLLASDDDQTFDDSAFHKIKSLYPHAKAHTFVGAGHSPASTQRDEYFRVVRKFLTE